MQQPKIYIASKVMYADKWRKLRDGGVNIISTWIDQAGAGQSPSLSQLAIACIYESRCCDGMIVYRESWDLLKGAFIEMGAALINTDTIICMVGDPLEGGAFSYHPQVLNVPTVEMGVMFIRYHFDFLNSVRDSPQLKNGICSLQYNEHANSFYFTEPDEEIVGKWEYIVDEIPGVIAVLFTNYIRKKVSKKDVKISAEKMRDLFRDWFTVNFPMHRNPLNLIF